MSIEEAGRLSVMQQIDKGVMTLHKASEELGLSLRQTKRVRKRYTREGISGLISKHRGKISPNRIDPKLKAAVVKIMQKSEYEGFGPTFMMEKLRQRHGYYLSDETLRKWMIECELWEAKKAKIRRVYQRRVRRARFGELLQGDGSRHDWFEGRGDECTLVLFVDDATSQITAGRFVKAETTQAYQEILEGHLKTYGRPLGLYVDKHSIFRVTREYSGAKESETHFGRVLKELDIELICAHSPEAKGRVERANGVLQDRLIKEMRLQNISTIEEANEFLPEFIEEYNRKFGVKPRSEEDAHRPMREEDDLERIFAKRAVRKLSKSLSFQYGGMIYQIQPETPHRHRAMYVEIMERPGKPVLIKCGEKEMAYSKWDSIEHKPQVLDSKELEAHWPARDPRKPSNYHPWRRG